MAAVFPATSMPDRDWWAALWPSPADVLHRIGITPDMTVLDLCCGDGYFTAPLAKIVGGKIYALDLDPAMIALAKAEVARQDTTVLKWICADAQSASQHLIEPVDYVLMANTFHGVPDQSELVESVHSMLRPNGRFTVVNWHSIPKEQTIILGKPRGPKTEMRMSPESVQGIVEPMGFRRGKVIQLPPFHYGLVFERT